MKASEHHRAVYKAPCMVRPAGETLGEAQLNIELGIVSGRIRAVIDEMTTILIRTSMSSVVKNIRDFACCICDRDGNLVAQNNGITVLTGTVSRQLRAVLDGYLATMLAGDIYITNDPYQGNTHLADVTLLKPVFVDGELLCFATVTAHWTDIGGSVAGSLAPDAREIFEEGIRIPALRIVRGGQLQDDLVELLLANIHTPAMTRADLASQLATVRVAETRLRDLNNAYGADLIEASFRQSLAFGERMSRAAISELPNGTYSARDRIETADGGFVRIDVSIKVRGDEIVADFTGSGPQQDSPINCTRGALEAAAKAALISVLRPKHLLNDGSFRPMSVEAPDGTILTAQSPAATGWCYEPTARVIDLVSKAFAAVIPEKVSAGSYTSLCSTYLVGHASDAKPQFVLVEPHVGGWGGSVGVDGANALIAAADGDTFNHSVELIEANYPIRVNKYELNTECGDGAGCYRGGLGVVREYEALADGLSFFTHMGRSQQPPWGIEGGDAGSINYYELENAQGIARGAVMPPRYLSRGDLIRICTGNGGGAGNPRARDPERVRSDVENGYINEAMAETIYGVALRFEEGAITINHERTRQLRTAVEISPAEIEGTTRWAS